MTGRSAHFIGKGPIKFVASMSGSGQPHQRDRTDRLFQNLRTVCILEVD
jgi:hypothetical protein